MSKMDMKAMFKTNSSASHWQEQSEKREAEMAAIEEENAPEKSPDPIKTTSCSRAKKAFKVKKVPFNLNLSEDVKLQLTKYAAEHGISASVAVENFIKKCAK